MKRTLAQQLVSWKNSPNRKPILLRGARQVGKTHLIRDFGKTHFDHVVEINFEMSPMLKPCFETLEVKDILNNIYALTQQMPTAGNTLLFLDEIQECPNAIKSLRYFYEKMPNLHVIGAGSLLEFAIKDENFSMPVGRVSYYYLRPLSFLEFLDALGYDALIQKIENSHFTSPLSEAEHLKCLQLFREYSYVGGMPEVVNLHRQNQPEEVNFTQKEILSSYQRDFGKYAGQAQHKYLQCIYEKAPLHIGEQIKYAKFSQEYRSRELKQAIQDLHHAGLVSPVYVTSASGFPLTATLNTKKFKLLFLDVGLMMSASGVSQSVILADDIILLNKGAVAEQIVGQELLAYQHPRDNEQLYFWAQDGRSIAEVDYVLQVNANIIPVEVKAGKTGRLKSLHQFIEKNKHTPFGIQLSSAPLRNQQNVLTIPMYMISQLTRLIKHMCVPS